MMKILKEGLLILVGLASFLMQLHLIWGILWYAYALFMTTFIFAKWGM